MLLRSIKLNNIRSYIAEEASFPAASLLLSGDIGSGKSTVLMAVEFALFGTSRSDLSGETLLRKGTKEGSVELEFSLDNKNFLIKRAIKKTKDGFSQTSGYILREGLKKELTPEELKAEIINLLGFPAEAAAKDKNYLYRYTVYCPQEEMREILEGNNKERQEILRKIFNLDKYKTLRENCALYTKELRQRIALLAAQIGSLEEIKLRLEESRRRKEELQSTEREMHLRLEILVQQLKERKELLLQIEQKIIQLKNIQKEIYSLQSQQILLEKQEQEAQEKGFHWRMTVQEIKAPPFNPTDLEPEIHQAEEKIREIKHQKLLLTERISLLGRRIPLLEEELKNISKRITELEEKQQKFLALETSDNRKKEVLERKTILEKEGEVIFSESKTQELQIAQAQEKIRKITAINFCPTCLREVDESHKEHIFKEEWGIVSSAEKQLQDIRIKKQEWEIKRQENKQEEELLLQQEKEKLLLGQELRQLADFSLRREKLEKEENELRQEKILSQNRLGELSQEDLFSQQKQIEEKKGILHLLREKERLETLIREAESAQAAAAKIRTEVAEKVTLLEEQAKAFAGTEEALLKKKEEFNLLLSEEKQLSTEHSRLKTLRENEEKESLRLDFELQEKQKLSAKKEYAQKIHFWLEEAFIPLTEIIERQVMMEINLRINSFVLEWFAVLMEGEEISARVDADFTPVIEQSGYEVFFENLSGGERTSTALAYRLALNKVINESVQEIKTKELIILDEPTEGFSTEQLDKLREVLERIGLKQIIIVSHEGKIESFVKEVVRIHKEGGVSRVIR